MDREIEVYIDWDGAARPVGRLWARAKLRPRSTLQATRLLCSGVISSRLTLGVSTGLSAVALAIRSGRTGDAAH